MLYEEVLDVLGMEPPAENAEQRAARVARELKGILTGADSSQRDGLWFVGGEWRGRAAQLMLDPAQDQACIGLLTSVTDGPDWEHRAGGSEDDERFVKLGLSAQSELRKLLDASGGTLQVHEGRLEYTPGEPNMVDRKAKDTLKRQLERLSAVAQAIDKHWS